MTSWKDEQVLIVGGGIGGLTAALALARQGIASQVIEQAAAFKEIGAGIQLGPNVFRMFERLGLIEPISAFAVFPNNLIMFDSITGDEVTRIPLDDAFRKKFHYPYALIHRADLHNVLLEQCRKSNLIRLDAAQKIVDVNEKNGGITAKTESGKDYRGAALIGADGLWSTIRELVVGDGKPKPAGHITYRAVLPTSEIPERYRRRDMVIWAGEKVHFVLYPLRAGARAPCQDRELAHVGALRPAADQGLEPRPHHAARRRRASDAAISGTGRLHGGRGRVCVTDQAVATEG